MRSYRSLVVAFACAYLAASAPAGVIVVDASGGGDFTTIQAAVDAAQDGDTVLVKPGTHLGCAFRAKSLTLVGDVGGVVQLTSGIGITGLQAGQTVVVADLRVLGSWQAPVAQRYGLYLADDLGAVRAQDCRLTGQGSDFYSLDPGIQHNGADGASASQCADVALSDCFLVGYSMATGGSFCNPNRCGSGLLARESNVALSGCALIGGSFASGGWGSHDGSDAGDGAWAQHASFLFSLDASFTGGFGGGAGELDGWCPGCPGYRGYGVHLAPGFRTAADSSAVLFAGSTLGGTSGTCGHDGQISVSPSIFPGGAAVVSGGVVRDLDLAAPTRDHQPLQVTLRGAPGDRAQLFVCDATTFEYRPEWNGVLLVDRTQPALPSMAAQPASLPFFRAWKGYLIPSSGSLTVTLPSPNVSTSEGARTLHVQALFTAANGEKFLSGHRCAIVLDASY